MSWGPRNVPVLLRYKSCPRYRTGIGWLIRAVLTWNFRGFKTCWINSWCYYLPTKIIPAPPLRLKSDLDQRHVMTISQYLIAKIAQIERKTKFIWIFLRCSLFFHGEKDKNKWAKCKIILDLFSFSNRKSSGEQKQWVLLYSPVLHSFPDFCDESPSITTLLLQQKYGAPSAPYAPERISINQTQCIRFQLVI